MLAPRSGVSAVLAPRSGVSAVLAPRSGSPSRKGWWSGDDAPRPFRSGVSAVLAPRSGSPSRKGWWSGSPAPRPSAPGSPRCSRPAPETSGDASRLNRPPTGRTGALLRSSLRFGRNTLGPVLPVGAPPSRVLSAGPPPGGLAHRENWASPLSVLAPLCPRTVRRPHERSGR